MRQFRVINGGRLEAEFDEPLVRRILEEAGEGIWEGGRTGLYLWLVVNDGERWLFRPVGFADTPPQAMNVRNVFSGALSRTFEEVSALRGIEIDFAPVPDPQAAGQCAEKLWIGDFGCLPARRRSIDGPGKGGGSRSARRYRVEIARGRILAKRYGQATLPKRSTA